MRRVIILETEPQPNGNLNVRYVLWASVPTARQPFWQLRQGASFVSAVQDGSVTTAESSALQSGAVAEKQVSSEWPNGTTFATAQPILKAAFDAWQTFVNGYDPWAHYGTFYDDSTGTWTVKAVA